MQVLENWHPKGITVYMDDKRFLNCVLTECKLVYGGGDVTWENTQFVNCQITFDGSAQRTVAYLQNFRADATAGGSDACESTGGCELEAAMETLYYSRMPSPAGPLLIGMSESALVILEFDRGLPKAIAGQAIDWQESEEHTAGVRQQLEEYFAGQRRSFDLPLDLRGTEFRKRCWNQLLQIPYGETRSYAEIARAVECSNGFRAVGQANHYNPIAIIVPCHRVLASNRMLGGYGGGLPVKAMLLRLEGAEFREGRVDGSQDNLPLSAV